MAKAKESAVMEVRRFAKQRDEQFDRAKRSAGNVLAVGWNTKALMRNPKKYLKEKFAKDGLAVVRELLPDARALGRDHAEKLGQLDDKGSPVR
jgi:hypothetical protein